MAATDSREASSPETAPPSKETRRLRMGRRLVKNFGSLIVSIGIMGALPTFGLMGLLPQRAKYPTFFGVIWASKYDLCGRLWIEASFLSTLILTGSILWNFLTDNRFDKFRRSKRFSIPAILLIFISITWVIVGGLCTAFLAADQGAIWVLKFMAFLLALAMLIMDYIILQEVKNLEPALEDEFRRTVNLIDFPATLSILFIIGLSYVYLYWLIPAEPNSPHESEIFIMGLSSGAVAVEVWFANFFFWYLLRKA